jgi:hypothetical protein
MSAIEYSDDWSARDFLARGSHDWYSPGTNADNETVLRCRTCGAETIWPLFRAARPPQWWVDAVASDCNPRASEVSP